MMRSTTIVCCLLSTLLISQKSTAQTTTVRAVRMVPSNPFERVQDLEALQRAALLEAQAQGVIPPEAVVAGAEPEVNYRLQSLMQLTFDRRASAILKSWANLDAPASSEKDLPDDLPPRPPSPEDFQQQALSFERDVRDSRWPQVAEFLKALPDEEGPQVYSHLLSRLSQPPANYSNPNVSPDLQPKQHLSPSDILALIQCAPKPLEKAQLPGISQLVAQSAASGNDLGEFIEQLGNGVGNLGGEDPQQRLLAGELLLRANLTEPAGDFLPLEVPFAELTDASTLDLLADYYWARYGADRQSALLQQTWDAAQAVLALGEDETVTPAIRQKTVSRAVELVPLIEEQVGQQWLVESYVDNQQRGMEILASIGSQVGENLAQQPHDNNQRLKTLKLQHTAVNALLNASGDLARQWRGTLDLLATNWLNEANLAKTYGQSSGGRPIMQIDMYGNYFYMSQDDYRYQQMQRNNRQPIPIQVADLLEIAPDQRLLDLISDSLQISFYEMFAELHLKISEETEAFPYIERIAASHPEQARGLVHRFLTAWTRNHDPNTDRRQRNPYIFMYGFEQKADGIPLTRSKQQRNLQELSEWIDRIAELPIEPIDEKYLATAFAACHSSAEVYRLEAFEAVFGSIDSLKPETVSGIAERMRSNLVEHWRAVRTQEASNTNRKEKDIQREVIRGYETARRMVRDALSVAPENWKLHLTLASLLHDENDYLQSVSKSSEYSERRSQAFAQFELAARHYIGQAGDLKVEDRQTSPFDLWFYASLGACDLGMISHETVPALGQYPRIREAIEGMPGELSTWHMDKFANNLFTRMSPLKPSVKLRYLKGGFEIVDEHPRALEARKLFQYYQDLITEIKLEAEIDGSDVVGHKEPFGLFVNLLHTPEIERESAGFSKYVTNQNNMMYAYNYGRPTENYREKFEDSVTGILSEHFEVISVIFENEKAMRSRETERDGWRITPYAYVMLKARGAEVDMIPSIKLDLDFLDTSGFAVLPIESASLPIDATVNKAEPRPIADLQVSQTLDERQVGEGKLILEISAKATGLVPDLEDILDLNNEAFQVERIDRQPLIATEFVSDTDEILVRSDRSWIVELTTKDELTANPTQFTFCSVLMPDVDSTYQRYEDADLLSVGAVVDLEQAYLSRRTSWLPWIALGGIAVIIAGVGIVISLTRRPREKTSRFEVPSDINPFSVIGLLRRMREENGFEQIELAELGHSIARLEKYYFDRPEGEQPDLREVAQHWVNKAE